MLHQPSQKNYENHQLILDHLDHRLALENHGDDHVQSSQFYKKSNISSTSSPEPHYVIQPQFRVIKDSRHYEDGFKVSSSEVDEQQHNEHHYQIEMGPPSQTPTKNLRIITSEEPTSSMPDLGKFHDKYPIISD